MNPHKISTLWELHMAVKSKKAVVVPKSPCWSKPRPAAFMINLPGAVIVKLFDSGMYIYKKKGD